MNKVRDDGFTLIELLIAIVILGVIMVPLSGGVLGYLKDTGDTTTRLSQSHDVQMASAYLAQDVDSLGMRDYSQTPPTPKQSVWTSGYPAGSCGATRGGQVLLVGWDDFSTVAPGAYAATAQPQQVYAAYVVEADQQLHRVRCVGTTVAADIPLTSYLQAANATSAPDPSSVYPQTVTLTLTIQGVGDPITLTGRRRQDNG